MSSKSAKARSIILATVLVLGTLVMAAPPQEPEKGGTPPDWPNEGDWINYTFKGERVRDWEDKPYETDPTHGPADVNPDAVDIASGVDATGGGPENNPGYYTSVQYYYLDQNDDSENFTNIEDDWMFFRMRVAGDPTHGGKYAYKAYHWDILLEVDHDEWKELVIDLNGGDGKYKFGTIGVFYNNSNTHKYEPKTDAVWEEEASGKCNNYTRAVEITYGNENASDNQWWIEYRIPVIAFQSDNGTQLIGKDTYFLLFFSTSASLTNPLQKDWMGEFVFGTPPDITVEKTALEDVVSPGDTIHYTIHYNNTGDFASKYVWINDTIPEGTTFESCSPAYDSKVGNVIKWFFENVPSGNHSILLNVTVDPDLADGTVLTNWVFLNYTDSTGGMLDESWDSVDVLVTGPKMEFSKAANMEYADPGDIITYTLTYSNIGAGTATEVTIVDTIPPETSFVNSTPMYDSVDNDTYTWNIGTVGGYTTGHIYINVMVDAYTPDGTILVNYATMDFKDLNGNPQDQQADYANVTVTSPIISISKVANVEYADPGDTINYTITYENTGNGTATDIVIQDLIPDYTTLIGTDPPYDDFSNGTITWLIDEVPEGSNGTINVCVKVNSGTPDQTNLTNVVILNYDDANGNPQPEQNDTALVVVTAPVISFSKVVNVDYADPGDKINYTINYSNIGTGLATSVVIEDTIPSYTTFVSSDPDPTSNDGNTYTWYIGDLSPDESGTIEIQVQVNAGVPDKTVLLNNATLDYDDANGNPYAQLKDNATTTVTTPVMTVSKEADTEYADPGDTIMYTITYTNSGTGYATNVTIKDTIPDDTTFVNSNPSPTSQNGKTYTWDIGTVAPGTTGYIFINVTVDAGTPDETVLTNYVNLTYEDDNGNEQPEEEDSVDVFVTAPIMTVSKEANVEYADPGDTIMYTITYTNSGTGNATNVVIEDTIPANTTFANSNPNPSSQSGKTYTWNIGTVGPGTTGYIFINVTVDAGTPDGTVLTNNVTLDYEDDTGNPQEEEDDSTNVTVTAPIMTVSKIANMEYADPGDTIMYTITYTNSGTGNATNVVIVDTIPADTTFKDSNPGPSSQSGKTYTWNLGTVGPGTTGYIFINVTVDAGTPDGTVLTNKVTLTYEDDNGNEQPKEEDSVDVTVTAPMMTVSKEANVEYADPGDTIMYTITYTNSGTGNATNVVIEDTIPANTTFANSNPNPSSQSGKTYTWNIGTVGPGITGYIFINVTVDAGTPDGTVLTNNVTLDYEDDTGNPQEEEDNSTNVTVTAPIMTVSKVANMEYADPGDTIMYTITYTNSGTGNATNVVIEDTIPADTTFKDSNPSPSSQSGKTYTWNIGTVGPGTTGYIFINVTVDAGTPDGTVLTNNVTLTYEDDNGNEQPEEEDSVDVFVTAPIMTVSKEASVEYADPGDTIMYTITYTNSGTGNATNVVIEDTIPANTTFANSNPSPSSQSGKTYTWNLGTVGPGITGYIFINVTVDAGTPDGTVLTNNVTLDYEDDTGNPQEEEDDSTNVTVTAPIMTVSKEANVEYADPGDTIMYTITYTNSGTGNATYVVIEDTIPADTTFKDSNPGPSSQSGKTYTWNIGTVAPGTTGYIFINVTVDAGTPDGTVLTNDVTLNYDDDNGNDLPEEDDSVDVTVTAPIMTISKEANVEYADPGDTIMYTITYTNSGTGNATNVVIEDTIPSDTTFKNSNPSYKFHIGDTYTWEISLVAPGTTGYIFINVTVDAGTPDKTILTNNVTLNYDDDNGNDLPEEDDSVDVTVTAPIMTVSKVANVNYADPGDTIMYTITYTNSGTGNATNVVIEDTIPANTTFANSNPSPSSQSGKTYTWNIGTVAPGTIGYIFINVTVDVGTPDKTVLTNDVTLSCDDDNGNDLPEEDDSVNVTVTAPVLTFSKETSVEYADPGDTITYTIKYKNIGTGLASGVYVTDTIPANTTFVGSNPPYSQCVGKTYTWNIGNVIAGGSGTITINVTVNVYTPDDTLLHNVATLDYADANGNYYPQLSDYADVTVTAPVITFTKTASIDKANPGDTIVYTLYYENIGGGEATGVIITDTIPGDTTFVSSDPMYKNVSGDTYTWDIGSLAAGGNGTITITVTVDPFTPDGTVLNNTATLDYSDANGNAYDQLGDYAEVTVIAPVMSIIKKADVTKADPGDTIVYTISYYNTGTGDATGVYVNDTIPGDTTFVSSVPNYNYTNGDFYSWYIGGVSSGASGTITITVTVDAYTPDGTLLQNVATLDYADTNGNYYPQLNDSADTTVTAPVMTITKTANCNSADPGDTIVYTIVYENTGSGNATDVVIVDTIPANTTFVSATPSPDQQNGDKFTWNIGTVQGETSGTITVNVTVDIGTPDGTLLHNFVTLNYDDANGNPQAEKNDSADVTVTAPVMSFSKSASVSTADPGDTFTYTLTYENSGSGVATLVVVNDTIPSDVTLVDSDPDPDEISGNTYTWNIGTVGAYSSGTITINVTVNIAVSDGTLLHNAATLDNADANGNYYPQLSDEADVTVTAPVMSFSKSASVSTADPGDMITYTLTYENSGSGNVTEVKITDTISSDVTFVGSNPSYDNVSGNTYTWNIGTVGAYSSGTITINVTVNVGVPDGTLLPNAATLDYADANGNLYDQLSDWANVTVTAPIMTVQKSADVTTADPGDYITYTIEYENSGTGEATDVVIVDTIPADTTFISSTPAYDSQSNDSYTWNFASISGGTNGTITIVVQVDAYTPDGTLLTNEVTLDYDDANGNPYTQEADTADVTVTAPVMTITKIADVTQADPGDTIIYTLNYTNTGSGGATDVVITDTIPGDTTFVSSTPMYNSSSGDTYTWNLGTVDGYSGGTITITVTVDVGTPDKTLLYNVATLDYDDANGNPYSQEIDYANVTVTAPIMTVQKSADVTTADPSDYITYTIEYENSGTGEATGVVIVDTIPANTTFINSTPAYNSQDNDSYTWNFASIPAETNGTITIIVQVDAYTPDGTLLTNKVTLDYDDANGNPYTQEADTANVTVTAPVMTITKTADVDKADPGDTIIYTLNYTNSGSGIATDVVIIDTIHGDTTFVSSTPMYNSSSGDTYTWNLGTVDGYSGGTITITVTVDVGTPDKTLLYNVATLDYDDANGNPYSQETDYANVTVTAPIMTVQKSADVTTADPSDYITYTIEYENSGTGEATDVVIVDTIPAETTFINSTPAYNSQDNDSYTWNFASIPGGTNGTITLIVQVDAYTPDGTVLTNTVTLDYNDANGNPYTQETDTANVTVTAPVMTIIKTADVNEADPGDTIVYTLNYTNSGSGVATDVVITDTIPEDTTFVSSVPMYNTSSGDTYTWNLGTVDGYSGGTITITVNVDVGTPDKTLLYNVATLDYDDANGNPYPQETNYANVTVTAPIMTVQKSADVTTADPSDYITYTIEYENSGTGEATGVVIVDTIPANTTFINSTPAYNSKDNDSYTWNFASIPAGTNGTITIIVQVDAYTPDGTVLTNEVTLDYNDANGNPYTQETDTANVTVTAPVMTIIKTADVNEADPGDTIVYTLNYTNSGSGVATDVVITDTIPGDTTFVSSTPMYNSSSGDTYTWNLGTVDGYSGGTITITVTVDAGTPDGTLLHNIATLDYDDANGNPYPQETDYADVTVTAPVLNITKTANVSEADPGDQITYTIAFENSGTGNSTKVWINDTIPADTTLVSTSPSYDYNDNDTYMWYYDLIENGTTVTITIIVKVDVGTPDQTLLHNYVTLDYSDDNGNPLDQESAFADVTVTAPVMSMTKTADCTVADPDDTIVYTIYYENTGTGWASGVFVNDTIPGYTTFVSSSPSYSQVNGNTYIWNISDLAPGGNGTITITVTVDVGAPDKELLHNVVTLDYADANGNYYPQLSDYADVTVTAPVLSITKTASCTTADPEDTIVYTIKYKNTGTGWASGVFVNDTIPGFTTFVSSSPPYSQMIGNTYIWYLGSIAPGGNGTITITVKVNVGTPDKELLHNVATLDYADANDNYNPQLSDYADVTVTAPVLSITKTADCTTADPDDTIVYTIKYKNTGTGWASGVFVNDTIPGYTTFVSSSPPYSQMIGNTYIWYLGSIAPGGNGTITITVKVNVGTPDKELLHNVATLDYADANGNYYPQLSDYADVTVTAPIMSITKTASCTTADPDDTIVYTIKYKNTGTGWASGVFVNDTIPGYTTFVSSSPSYSQVNGNTYIWNLGNIAPGGSGTIKINVTVDIGAPDNELLHNVVTLDYADANGNYYPQLSDYADVKVTSPVMSITKTASCTTADPDDTLVYTIKYKNTGTGWASGVFVNDTIPGYTTFVSSSPAYSQVSGNTYIWNISNLAPGGSGTITITVKVNVGTPDKELLHNVATLDYADANGNYYPQLSDYADVTVTAPVMSITKTASCTTANPDDTIVYTIKYKNAGTGWASGVFVNDTIPGYTTFVSSSPPYSQMIGNTYIWYLGSIAPGGNGIITITVKVNVGTPDKELLHNVATLDYADANGNYYLQLSDYADVTVTAPVMSITKTASCTTADPDDTIVYTIKYKNTGTGWASGVYVNDTIPGYTTFVSSSPPYSQMIGNTYIWYLGNIAPSGSGTITITVKVNISTPDKTLLHNVATLNYADANSNYYPQLSDYADVTVTAPVMSITKTASCTTADPDDTIVYTIKYKNTGTGWASGVFVNDTIPGYTTLVGTNPAYSQVIGNTYIWNLGNIAPGVNGTITITVTVDVGTPDKELLHNVATLDYADANSNYYPQLSDYADVTVSAPVISITKTASCTTADPDDTIVYTIKYKNTGTGWASGVFVNDTIPGYTTLVSTNPSYSQVIGNTYIWNLGNIAPGGNGTITITVKVNISTPDNTLLHNVATLDYADANSNYYPQLSDYADVTVTAPVMSITKTASCTTADPDDTIVYTIKYKNTGTGWASGVFVNDTIPGYATLVSSSPPYSQVIGNTYIWNLGSIAPGGSGTITITVKVNVSAPDNTLLHNVATLDYADANSNYYPQLSDYADVTVTAPIMSINKTANVLVADPGDTIVYTIKYKNTGTGWASGVFVNDTIPGYATLVSSSPPYSQVSGNTYIWNLGNIAPGGSGTITITVKVNTGTPDETILHNVVTLDYADANGNYYLQLSDYADVIVTAPIILMTKTADCTTADPGDTIHYTIEYKNIGTGWATGVFVNDTIPANTTFVSSNPGYVFNLGDLYIYYIGNVAPKTNGTVNITVKVDVGTADKTLLRNWATLDYGDANCHYYPQLDDYADVKVTAPVLSFTKIANVLFADPGDTILYTIKYENTGTGWASGVYVNDTIPGYTTFVSSNPTYSQVSGNTYIWFLNGVAPNGTGTITITVKVDIGTADKTLLHNFCTLDYADANGNYYDQLSDYANVTVTAPVMLFSKTADNSTAYPGDPIVYTIEYENIGTGWASGVVMNDTIPEDTTFVSSNPSYSHVSGNTYIWNIGDVAPSGNGTITITVKVNEGTPDKTLLPNLATFDYADANGNYYDQLSDYANVTVTAPIMLVNKTAEVSTVDPGGLINYLITYENAGTGWEWDFYVNDTLPLFTTFVYSDPPYSYIDNGTYVWHIGAVAPGTVAFIELTVRVTPYTPDQTVIVNEIENVSSKVTVTAPIMSINKTADCITADPGDLITYTIKFNNTGTGNASGVYINDTIPADTTFVSSSMPYILNIGDLYIFYIGKVTSNTTVILTITVMVDIGTPDKTLLHNTVTLAYADANGNYYPELDDYADVIVTAPVMSLTKTVDVTDADPGDPIVYTIDYENTGTGWASGVYVNDTIPNDTTFVGSNIPYSQVNGNTYIWYIGNVAPGASGTITITVKVNVGTADKTLLHNVVTLDYCDANCNFIERLNSSADVVVTAPVMILSKEAGEAVIEKAYVKATLILRIAGEKWHNVIMYLIEDGVWTEVANLTRYPGDPDEQAAHIENVTIDVLNNTIQAAVFYTPWDDPINGQWWGANPCWLILKTEDGRQSRIHHTFNVRHEETWQWFVDDFRPYLLGLPITYEVSVMYTITYENIGTGHATNVIVNDTLPLNASFVILDSNPAYDSLIGHNITWYIGFVLSGELGHILMNISYICTGIIEDPEAPYCGLLTNNVTLDYCDANGNFIERLRDSVDVFIPTPEISFSKKSPHYSTSVYEDCISYIPDSHLEFTFYEEEVIHFTAFAPYPCDEAYLTFQWNFGDGDTAFGEKVTHTYLSPGRYDITLTVCDANCGETIVNSIATVLEKSTSETQTNEEETENEPSIEDETVENEVPTETEEVDVEPSTEEGIENEGSIDDEEMDVESATDEQDKENEVSTDDEEVDIEPIIDEEDKESKISTDEEVVEIELPSDEEESEIEMFSDGEDTQVDVEPEEIPERVDTQTSEASETSVAERSVPSNRDEKTYDSELTETTERHPAKIVRPSSLAMFAAFIFAINALAVGMFTYYKLKGRKRR